MKTFVLVHGAWVGEWCFDPIIPLLNAKGHEALAVSLTGYGRKSHLHRPDITVTDHIHDVVEYVHSRNLQAITLVGHSYGGAVVTGAWDQLRERVVEVFFIDASTPADGESHYEHVIQYDDSDETKKFIQKALVDGVKTRPFPISALGRRDPEKAAFMQNKVMPHPLSCALTPIHLKNGALPSHVPKTFILCKKNQSYHQHQAKDIKADPLWRYAEIDTYHDAMYEDPEGLVDILTSSRD